MSNAVTPREKREVYVRAKKARETIAARFLAAAEIAKTADPPGPVAVPAYLSLRGIRILDNGGLAVTMQIPAEFVGEAFLPLTHMTDKPLAVTLEEVDLGEGDPFA